MQGLPASGKTYIAKNHCAANPDFIRVNRDDLRTMIWNYKYPDQENLIKEMEMNCAKLAIDNGYSIIVDGLNFSQSTINKWKTVAKDNNMDFETRYIYCPLETCIKRDRERPNSVGENVIRGIYDQYLNIK